MFILRAVRESDLEDLIELSQLFVFINLPNDPAVLKKQIQSSIKSFKQPSKNLFENYYLFVLEDLETQKVIGASMIHGKHGTDEEPHFYFKVGREHKFSESINTGFIHGTLKFGLETDGYTEIGGLVLNPAYRGSTHKLGKQLSFVRFLYMGLKPDEFTEYVHSELMPPLDEHGNSALWEAIGRRFLNMNYQDADLLSRKNKEFILSLFPVDTIYETLLPPDARNAIGKVGDSTKPVKKMLESIGFQYTEEVDPFDGGPHFRAKRTSIKLIKEKFSGIVESCNGTHDSLVLINIPNSQDEFSAIYTKGTIEGEQIKVPTEIFNLFKSDKQTTGIYL